MVQNTIKLLTQSDLNCKKDKLNFFYGSSNMFTVIKKTQKLKTEYILKPQERKTPIFKTPHF